MIPKFMAKIIYVIVSMTSCHLCNIGKQCSTVIWLGRFIFCILAVNDLGYVINYASLSMLEDGINYNMYLTDCYEDSMR